MAPKPPPKPKAKGTGTAASASPQRNPPTPRSTTASPTRSGATSPAAATLSNKTEKPVGPKVAPTVTLAPSKTPPPPPVDISAGSSSVLDSSSDPEDKDGDGDDLTNPATTHPDPRGSRAIKPLTWWQKISVSSILGKVLFLLKRLTAFPMLSSAAIYFDEDDRFDPSGNRKSEPLNDNEGDMNPPSERVEVAVNYERATQALFEAIIRYRKEAKSAKDNYHTVKVNLDQYPEWNDNLVDRLRSTFQVFDITGDGLLDFEEFCTTLDEFGDGTTMELRKKYFATIDDGSGSIDFSEFLRLVYKLTIKTPSDAEELAQTFQSIDRNMGRIRSLDVVQQLQAGLF